MASDWFILDVMQTVGAFEAKTHLSALLEKVAKGEKVMITRRGVPVAMLVPVQTSARKERAEVIRELMEFGRGRKLRGMTIRDLIEEGRRF